MLHFHTPKNWINDPNGFIYYNGKYHLFCQYFPYGNVWGTMHWAHAVSDDLVNWQHLDMALFPTIKEDQNGCFSGTAMEKDGKMHLFYTGVRYPEPNPQNIHKPFHDQLVSAQLELVSEDGFTFDNFHGKNILLPVSNNQKIADAMHTRDPKVWPTENGYTMLLGTTVDHQGRLLFYTSPDLKEWTLKNTFEEPNTGWMYECPDLFKLDNEYVLIYSPMGNGPYGFEENQAMAGLVHYDEDSCELKFKNEMEPLDWGYELYAPQSNLDENGRRVVFSWLRMPKGFDQEPWIGLFDYPRVLNIQDGKMKWSVHPNILEQFAPVKDLQSFDSSKPWRVKTRLKKGEVLDFGGLKIGFDGQAVYTDRSQLIHDEKLSPAAFAPAEGEEVEIDLFGDKYIYELFINDGQKVITQYVDGFKPVTKLPKEELELFLQK